MKSTFFEFGGRIPGTPILLDRFDVNLAEKICFLSHFHADHFPGLNSQFQCKSRIYCSTITRELLIHRFPFLPRELIIDLPVEEPIHLSWGEETSVTVTAIDASHCPGSLMFLFVGRFPEFSSLLYTGDFRYENTSLLQQSPTLSGYLAGSGVNKLDWLIFDSTFCEQTQKFSFPSRDEAIDIAAQKINQLVIYNKITSQSVDKVFIAYDYLGLETLLLKLSESLPWKKIYINPSHFKSEEIQIIAKHTPQLTELLSHITTSEQETKLQVFRSSGISIGLSDFAKIKKMKDEGQNVVIVKCSAQWFCLDKHKLKESKRAIYDPESDMWRVLFSMHSNFAEVQAFVDSLKPRFLFPFVQSIDMEESNKRCFSRSTRGCFRLFPEYACTQNSLRQFSALTRYEVHKINQRLPSQKHKRLLNNKCKGENGRSLSNDTNQRLHLDSCKKVISVGGSTPEKKVVACTPTNLQAPMENNGSTHFESHTIEIVKTDQMIENLDFDHTKRLLTLKRGAEKLKQKREYLKSSSICNEIQHLANPKRSRRDESIVQHTRRSISSFHQVAKRDEKCFASGVASDDPRKKIVIDTERESDDWLFKLI